jgi:ABC-type bacteriocin/lantibiotic exporter with double-glycine peptidase domain
MNIGFLKRVFLIFSSKEKYQVSIIFILSIITSIFEMIGVFSIVPFMSLLTNPDYITNNVYFSYFANSYSLNLIDSKVYFGIIIIILFIFSNLMNIVTLWYTMNFIAEYQSRISSTVLKKYLSNSYDFFIKSDHAILSKNVLDESCILADGVIYAILQILTKSLIIFAISILMIIVNPELFFGSIFLFAIIYLLIFVRYKKVLYDIGFNRVEANESRFKKTREVLSNIKDVKYHSLEDFYIKSFSNSAYDFAHLNAKRNLISLLPRYFIEILTFGGIFSGIVYLIAIEESLLLNIPVISMFLLSIYRIMPLLQNIFINTTNIKSSEYVFNNIEAILSKPYQIKSKISSNITFTKNINFENVYFNYVDNKNILENVNLEISKGETYAIIGGTGTGKTTIIDILLGFYDIKSGQITMDGFPLKGNSFKSINKIIGYVSQSISYLSDNILKNITFCDNHNDIDIDKVMKVIRITKLDDLVKTLDKGIYGNIGDMGSMLSGGQKQRLGIARALYREPQILILDEATNALDRQTELEILTNIKESYQSITLILVTHRNTYLEFCDKIIEISDKKTIMNLTGKINK